MPKPASLTVPRLDVIVPPRLERRKTMLRRLGALWFGGFFGLVAWPHAPSFLGPVLGIVGAFGFIAFVANQIAQRRNGAPARLARTRERELLASGSLDRTLRPGEVALDSCAVLPPQIELIERPWLYLLTNRRLLVLERGRPMYTIPLRSITHVTTNPTGIVDAFENVLSATRGTGELHVLYAKRGACSLLFPNAEEAKLAADAIREAIERAPPARPGALAIADDHEAGALAFASAGEIALVEEHGP